MFHFIVCPFDYKGDDDDNQRELLLLLWEALCAARNKSEMNMTNVCQSHKGDQIFYTFIRVTSHTQNILCVLHSAISQMIITMMLVIIGHVNEGCCGRSHNG